MKLTSKYLLIVLGAAAFIPCTAPALPVLSGLTLYTGSANGTFGGTFGWNTREGTGSDAFNVYLFTGSLASPTFLNTGNTDASLNPNFSLSAGFHTFQFAGNLAPSGSVGLNLYFDNNLTQNRITAVVPHDGSSSFSVVGSGISTYGLPNNPQLGSGSLSYTASGFTVTLTDFQASLSPADLVGNYATGPDGTLDTVGRFTLNIVAVPEPSAGSLGVAALVLGTLWKFGRRKGAGAAGVRL